MFLSNEKPKRIWCVMTITDEGHESIWRAYKYKCEAKRECDLLNQERYAFIEEVVLY